MENQQSQLKAGVILNYVNMILGNLIPIFYTPIMLELLGQSEYGLYKLSSSVTSYLSLISLGIGSAVTRYLIKYRVANDKEGEERVLGLFMVIFQVIAVVSFLIGIALTMSLHLWYSKSLTPDQLERMRILVFLMVCNMAISFSVSPYVSVVNAHEKFIFLQCMNIVTTCIGPLMNLVMLWLGFASIGMAAASLGVNVFAQLCYLIYIRRSLKIRARYKNLPVHLIKEIFCFSFWVFVATLVNLLSGATDTVMIGAVPALATTGTAIYSVGQTLNGMVLSVTTGVSNILSPKTNRMVFSGASQQELLDFAIRIGRVQAYIFALLVTGFIAFGRPFIRFYAGYGYEEAYWVAILLMVPNMIPLVQSIFLSIIMAENRHRFRSLVYFGIAIMNVIGTWFLMQVMGIVGAALMTGIALFLGQGLVMNWYYWKRIGMDIPQFWKQVGKIYIIPAIMCVITLLLAQIIDFYDPIIWCIGVFLYVLIYCALNWRFKMNDYEKRLVLGPLNMIKNKLRKK